MATKTHTDEYGDTYDVLQEQEAVMVVARNLKPGMVVLDPILHTPSLVVDHKVRAPQRSGESHYLTFDLMAKRYYTLKVYATKDVPVMAAKK